MFLERYFIGATFGLTKFTMDSSGGCVKFLYDNWLGDGPIVDFLPVVGNHKLLVEDIWDGVGWKSDEVRPLVDEYMFQKITLSNVRVREGKDMLVWKHTVDGEVGLANYSCSW